MAAAGVGGRCIFCHAPLPANQSVEHFPVGERIAFDPHRGRLWAVCPACRRWNLAPFEERWEALEELEKARVDRGRTLASTENIALIEVPGVELVRVGNARLAEEAWWRYGSDMMRRRSRARLTSWAEIGAVVGLTAVTGGSFYLFAGGDIVNNFLRWRRFGFTAWRGEARCDECGRAITELTFRGAQRLFLERDERGDPAVRLRCAHCRWLGRKGELRIGGAPARHVLRRVVTRHHFRGASEKRVRSATDFIEDRGAPEAVTRELAGMGLRLDSLLDRHRRTEAVALEIALNEENERRLLQMELSELEARWREEEEIAAIVDGELTEVPGVERLREG